jgi:choline dehydrogenase
MTARRRRSGHGFQAHVGPMRSQKPGQRDAALCGSREAPVIRFNYMSHPDDWTEFRAASG